EGGDCRAVAHVGKIARLQFRRAVKRDRTGAEPLHGDSEIPQSVAEGQNLAVDRERAYVQVWVQPAVLGRYAGLEESRLAERRHTRAARVIGVVAPPPSASRLG